MSRRSISALVVVAGLLVSAAAQVRGQADPFDPPSTLDPVEIERALAAAGDDGLLVPLAENPSVALVQAAPRMNAPELALPALAELAAGRDPWLAPAAMQSILRIADRPLLLEMSRRETDVAALEAVRSTLERLMNDADARQDLRQAATVARAQLTP